MKKRTIQIIIIMTAVPIICICQHTASANPGTPSAVSPSTKICPANDPGPPDINEAANSIQNESPADGEQKMGIKEWFRHRVNTVLKKMDLDRHLEMTEDNGLEYFRLAYRKRADKPARQLTAIGNEMSSSPLEKAWDGYGLSLSSQVNVTPQDIIDDIVFKMNANYFNTFFSTIYGIDKNQLTIEFTNNTLNKNLGVNTGILLNNDNDGSSQLLQFSIKF